MLRLGLSMQVFPCTAELEEQIMEDLAQPYVQGLTLAGENHSSIRGFSAAR